MRAVAAHPAGGTIDAMLGRASAALGVELRLTDSDPGGGIRVPVSGDEVDGWLGADRQEGDLALGVDLVLQLAAAAVRKERDDARRADDTPAQSRAEVLSELLANTAQGRGEAVRRARALGIPIDRWHVAVRLEFEELGDGDGGRGELAAYENRIALGRSVLAGARAGGGVWHTARNGTALVLLRMYDEDPGVAVSGEVARTIDEVLSSVRARLATSVARCGIGTAHMGAAGLVASATEAKAALTAARTAGRVNEAVPFDSVGLRRTLVEWYSSEVAQEAVASVLAPLNELGGAQSERLVRTLQVYLDHGRSLSKTGDLMNLHRNAVAYRIHKIFDVLDVDQDNPDDLLLLQLACRARDLS
jgi:sugar diacid utilization regulator